MNGRQIEAGLLCGATALALVAFVEWRAPLAPPPAISPTPRVQTMPEAAVSDSALAEAEELTVASDPFRLSNTPPAVRYDPTTDGVPLAARPAPAPRPTLVLKAIVGGPPWQALIDGLPGQPPSTVVSVGGRYDKLLVRNVTRDTVVIQGPDTSWTLTFGKRP